MKKVLIVIISLVVLLGVGFVYLVKNPELPIAQKVLSTVGMDKKSDLSYRILKNKQNDAPPLGMHNPASRNCGRNGGTIENIESATGIVGMCTLEDGSVCEQRAYMRGTCGMENKGTPTQANPIQANPEISGAKGTACTMDYTPVCASVQVQCIKAPCPPIEQTFGNKCMMDTNGLATFLYEGECK